MLTTLEPTDALYDFILANLQFGKWSNHTFTNEETNRKKKISLTIAMTSGQSPATTKRIFPYPDVLAEEIAENLESALASFREVLRQLKKKSHIKTAYNP